MHIANRFDWTWFGRRSVERELGLVTRPQVARYLKSQGLDNERVAQLMGVGLNCVQKYTLPPIEQRPLHPALVRQRRWRDLLPLDIAKDQAINERDRALMRARDAGASYAEIARHLGVSVTRVRELVKCGRRRAERLTPIEKFLNRDTDLRALARCERTRDRCPTCGAFLRH